MRPPSSPPDRLPGQDSNPRPDAVRGARARSILSPTSGFIASAGFTHSLTPARNCTFGCLYCYVPTMRIFGGLRPDDWRRWGQFTTFKDNAAELLRSALRPRQRIYCSPLTDPYQPAEADRELMPAILRAVLASPPQAFTIQTRGPLILRDLALLTELSRRTTLRISFSLTTDREDVRRRYEPHCAPIAERIEAMRALRDAGLTVFATLAPILPCDPRRLAELALEASDQDVIADPFHTRAAKPRGATTRDAAVRLSERLGLQRWHDPVFQSEALARIEATVVRGGRRLGVGPEGFAWLAKP